MKTLVLLAAAAGALTPTQQTRSVFLAKPTATAAELEAHFARHGCEVRSVDAHDRFAFVEFASAETAAKALRLSVVGPYRQAKPATAPRTNRAAAAASAWDALARRLRPVRAGVVVPRSHADRVAARLEARGHVVADTAQVGVERLLLLRPGVDVLRPGVDAGDAVGLVAADAALDGIAVPLTLDGSHPVADVGAAAARLDALLRRGASEGRRRVRVRTSPPALAADVVRRLEALTDGAYELAPQDADVAAGAAIETGRRGACADCPRLRSWRRSPSSTRAPRSAA